MTLPSTHCNGEWKRRVLKLWVCLIGGALQLNTGKFHWAYKRQRETGTETKTNRDRDRQRQTETDRKTVREKETETETERQGDRDKQTRGQSFVGTHDLDMARCSWQWAQRCYLDLWRIGLRFLGSEVSRVWGLRFLDIHLLWCIGGEVLWESFCNNCGHWGKCIEEYCNRKYYILLIKYIQNWAAEIDQKCTTTCF